MTHLPAIYRPHYTLTMTMYFKEKCSNRGELLKQLSQAKFLSSDSPGIFHGRLYKVGRLYLVLGFYLLCNDNKK